MPRGKNTEIDPDGVNLLATLIFNPVVGTQLKLNADMNKWTIPRYMIVMLVYVLYPDRQSVNRDMRHEQV